MTERSPSDDEIVEEMEEALLEPPPVPMVVVDSFQTRTADIPVGQVYEITPIRRTPAINFLPYVRTMYSIGDKKPDGENT
jgi:hypothetical protein